MADTLQNSQRILKNTIALSGRLLLTIFVGVYASRVLLQNLGEVDLGVYNVVAGVITIISILNVSFINGVQRYLNFYLGKNDHEMVCKVFSTSIKIFLVVGLAVILFGETAGLALVNYNLNIPADRLSAANWVYQFTIVSTVIDIVSVPYNSLMIAMEKMVAFAYVEVARSLLMLMFAMALPYIPLDRLIAYAALVMLLMVAIRLFYSYYCTRHFADIHYIKTTERSLLREMCIFSGWSFPGVFAYISFTYGLTYLINIFFGPVVNAAQALAFQVQSTLAAFAQNFMMAVKPQITKNYAEDNLMEMRRLVLMSSKLSYGIITIVSIPFLVRTNEILDIWLADVPQHTAIFMQVMLLVEIVRSLATPIATAIQATGKVKVFQTVEALILLLTFPTAYCVLTFSGEPENVYFVLLAYMTLSQAYRAYYLAKTLAVSVWMYMRDVVVRMVVFVGVSYVLCQWLSGMMGTAVPATLAVIVASVVVTAMAFWLISLDNNDRQLAVALVKQKTSGNV